MRFLAAVVCPSSFGDSFFSRKLSQMPLLAGGPSDSYLYAGNGPEYLTLAIVCYLYIILVTLDICVGTVAWSQSNPNLFWLGGVFRHLWMEFRHEDACAIWYMKAPCGEWMLQIGNSKALVMAWSGKNNEICLVNIIKEWMIQRHSKCLNWLT